MDDRLTAKRLRHLGLLVLSLGWLLPGLGARAATPASSLGLSVKVNTGPPEPVGQLTATSVVEGQADLSWIAPDEDAYLPAGYPVTSYVIRYATFSVTSLAGDTTAWWTASSQLAAYGPGLTPGSNESFVAGGLDPGATYFFAIRSYDVHNFESPIDVKAGLAGQQASTVIYDAAPSSPTNVTIVALSSSSALLNWNAVAAPDLDFYRIDVDSTAPYDFANRYSILVASSALSYQHDNLTPAMTYSYRIVAVDRGAPSYAGNALESPPSATVTVAFPAAGKLPMEPLGVQVVPGANTVTLTWSPTTRFADGTPFASSATPTTHELIGYAINRATSACDLNFINISSLTFSSTTWSDVTGGLNYYYRIYSYNTFGVSSSALTVSSLGDRNFFANDCRNMLTIDPVNAAALNGATNGLGVDIHLTQVEHPEEISGSIFQSVEWRAMLNGVTELTQFALPKPARISLHFGVQNGVVVPAGTHVQGLAPNAAVAPKDLGMYWHNGADFKKMYGKVDQTDQTVTVESPNVGRYQIRALFRSNGVVFDLSNISNRVITPNGDGLNDQVIFTYDPGPNNDEVRGRIYDVNGAFISDMRGGLVPNTLIWDGRANGRVVTSGVYVYKFEGGGKTYTGTVVVAR